MKIGFREKIILAGAGLIVFVIAWYVFYYNNQKQEISKAQQEIVRITTLVRNAQNSSKMMDAPRAEVDSLQSFLTSMESRILPKSKLLYITETVQRRGEEIGLKISSITIDRTRLFGEESSASPFLWIPIEIGLEGEFFALGDFLDDFKNYSFIIKPGEIKIVTDNSMYPILSVFLITYAYVSS